MNKHHLRPRSRGGEKLTYNLLLIKVSRHNAWHVLYGNRTLNEIIVLLRYLLKDKELRNFPHSKLWTTLWGKRDLWSVIQILERLQRIKKKQRLRIYL